MQASKKIQQFLTQSDVVNGFWDEFEKKHETQKEEHPWKLKYFVALAFAEGVAAGMRHAKGKEN